MGAGGEMGVWEESRGSLVWEPESVDVPFVRWPLRRCHGWARRGAPLHVLEAGIVRVLIPEAGESLKLTKQERSIKLGQLKQQEAGCLIDFVAIQGTSLCQMGCSGLKGHRAINEADLGLPLRADQGFSRSVLHAGSFETRE